jgi:hypothetical protein
MVPEFGPEERSVESRLRVYSSVLDEMTCAACAALAGLEFDPSTRDGPSIPNPACTHPLGCRCAWI